MGDHAATLFWREPLPAYLPLATREKGMRLDLVRSRWFRLGWPETPSEIIGDFRLAHRSCRRDAIH